MVQDIYDQWVRANEKSRAYILACISDVLNKKHEVMPTAREIMVSLQEMFEHPSSSIRLEAIKYVYGTRMKNGSNVREHVLDMMVHFNIVEAHGAIIDEISQLSMIFESLPKSYLLFRTNVVMNKITYNLTTFLNELQTYQSMMKLKEK
ncbi:uncharacterized protein LOC120090582 [Benincasa hispida]|uniref:uncharacterized protein LOC120090582 n=1 Tax=Benincasa hispida TaxID=102211 RepID=UPI0019012090|nr:uncharacterized protein LOC120090582 [Benincasa hispida]